jgi:hypothetical protein
VLDLLQETDLIVVVAKTQEKIVAEIKAEVFLQHDPTMQEVVA